MLNNHEKLKVNIIFTSIVIVIILIISILLNIFPPSTIQGASISNIYTNQLDIESYKLLNKDRDLYNRLPLKSNYRLNLLANIRAHQIEHHFSHYNHSGYPMTTIDAISARLPRGFKGSENIATEGLGRVQTIGDTHTFNNHNGKDMAKMTNTAMMFHDQLENNGHRKNILDQNNTLVGIGTAHNPNTNKYYLVEDFGNHNNNSSEDVQRASFTNSYPSLKSSRIDSEIKNKIHVSIHLLHHYLINAYYYIIR